MVKYYWDSPGGSVQLNFTESDICSDICVVCVRTGRLAVNRCTGIHVFLFQFKNLAHSVLNPEPPKR